MHRNTDLKLLMCLCQYVVSTLSREKVKGGVSYLLLGHEKLDYFAENDLCQDFLSHWVSIADLFIT